MNGARPAARPLPRAVRALRAAAIGLVLSYTAGLVVFALIQRSLLYFPDRFSASAESTRLADLGAERVPSRHGDVLGYRLPHEGGADATLIVAHGNAGSALDRGYFVALARGREVRYEVLLVEYPGYGVRAGEPSEAANVEAVVEAIDLARRAHRPIVLLGESLGSAVVSLAAARRPADVAALVLVTPLPRMELVAAHHYPLLPGFLLADRYEADAALERFGKPVAFVVAGEDEVVPTRLGLGMHAGYTGPKRLVVDSRATHNTVDYTHDASRWTLVFDFVRDAIAAAR